MLTKEILEDFRYIVLFGATEEIAREMLVEARSDALALGWETTRGNLHHCFLEYSGDRFFTSTWKIMVSYPGKKMCGLNFGGQRPDFCLYRGKPRVRSSEDMDRIYKWFNKVFLPAFRKTKYPHTMFHPA